MSTTDYLRIDNDDTLIVALCNIQEGTSITIDDHQITIAEDIPAKQKFALVDIAEGEKAVMYGVIVGQATKPIKAGERITTGNLKHATNDLAETGTNFNWNAPTPYTTAPSEFMGFKRPDGRVGTANYWIVVPLVFCSNQELYQIKDVLPKALGYNRSARYAGYTEALVNQLRKEGEMTAPAISLETYEEQYQPLFENVDGLSFLIHSLGCGNTPGDIDGLYALLANYITHPNVAGATVISLGCQKAELETLRKEVESRDPDGHKLVFYYDRQSWSGPGDMLEDVIFNTMSGMKNANKAKREPVAISELTIGVECGGSDGFSGISANPVIGRTIDHLISLGGTGILSEFPELCGVENELVSRCVSKELAERFIHLTTTYRKQVQAVGSDFDLNPSPGNIRDGLITDAMKSAGAAKKGGTSPVCGVHDYGERVIEKGLNLLCTPGSDVESVTALVGAGANLVIFSTGLGTPTGNPIVPVIKVSTNNELARRLEYMIDFNTGPIITGEESLDEMAEKLLRLCEQTASGQYKTKATRLGQEDFIPWKRGVSL